jgi:hypothetical protein
MGLFAIAAMAVAGLVGIGPGAAPAQDEAPLKLESIPARSAEETPLPGETPLPNEKDATQIAPAPVEAPAAGARVVVTPAPVAVPAVWVPGRLVKDPDTMVWIEGRWIKPLIGAPRYVAGQYERRLGLVRWEPGHWQGGVTPVVTETRPVATGVIRSEPAVIRAEAPLPAATTGTGSVTVLKPAAPAVVVPATPAATYTPGYWKLGLLGNYRWVPARVSD